MTTPEVSVLLPFKNAARTVEGATLSILGQQGPTFELIAIDDGSTDDSVSRMAQLSQGDSRLRVLRSPGVGVVAALRFGQQQARSDLIARMDADDLSLPGRLAKSLALLRSDDRLAAVGTQVEIFREDQPVSPSMQSYGRWLNSLTSPELLARRRFIESPLCQPSVIFRKPAIDSVGGYEEGFFPEDYQLWLKLLDANWKLAVVPEILHHWRDSNSRLTRADPRFAQECFWQLKATFLARLIRGECAVWGAGPHGRNLARELMQRGARIDRFVDVDVKKIGKTYDGIPVVGLDGVPPLPNSSHGLRLISAVGTLGVREEITAFLLERGWTEGTDFLAAA